MKQSFLILSLLSLITILSHFQAKAQQVYTDYKPNYSKWTPNYLLDKIEYTKTRMIFHYRYVGTSAYGLITFYGIPHEDHWALQNAFKHDQVFDMLEIRNLRKNGVLLKWQIINDEESEYNGIEGDVFTCEVHFPRLPNNIFKVHFLEGINARMLKNHFHCLNVFVKTFNDKDLGKESDMVNRIRKFEEINLGYVVTPPPIDKNKPITPKKDTPVVQNNIPTKVPVKKPVIPVKQRPKPKPVEEAQAQVG
jgi:hypothetical protein